MRQDQIETAIQKLSGERFEDFVNEILRQTEFPGLIPIRDRTIWVETRKPLG